MVPSPTNLTGSKFKNERGILLTRSLFFETSLNADLALYTLKDFDHTYDGRTYPSLYLLYMAERDPIEYGFATKHLDSWAHWESLSQSTFFLPYVTRWRKELDLSLKAEALANLVRDANDPKSPTRTTSNKYIMERGWEPKESQASKKGRPTKADIASAAYDLAKDRERIEEDFNRLSKVN